MDDDLRAIREARLRELKQRSGQENTSQSAQGGAPGSGPNEGNARILSQILEPSAQERLNRVALVRPERVQAVEQYLLQSVRSGAIRNKLTEKDIVGILESVGRDEKKKETRIIFDRREYAEDERDVADDSEDDFFDE